MKAFSGMHERDSFGGKVFLGPKQNVKVMSTNFDHCNMHENNVGVYIKSFTF